MHIYYLALHPLVPALDLSLPVMHAVDMATPDDWARLASRVRQRRRELHLTQEEVASRGGPSTATQRIIERGDGDSYRRVTLIQLEESLDWPRGTVDAILRGEEPTESREEPGSSHEGWGILELVQELKERLDELERREQERQRGA